MKKLWKCYIENFFEKESGVINLSDIFILNEKDNVGCALEDMNSKENLDLAWEGEIIL